MTAIDIIDDTYGAEEDGLVPDEDDEGVEVSRHTLQPSGQQGELQEAVEPLVDCEDYGISNISNNIGMTMKSTIITRCTHSA